MKVSEAEEKIRLARVLVMEVIQAGWNWRELEDARTSLRECQQELANYGGDQEVSQI